MTSRLLAVALATAAAAVSAQAPPATMAITNVSVLPMDRERVLADHTVLWRGDRILAVAPSGTTQVPAGATRIDGRGKFLLPALAEMHAHIPGGQASGETVAQVLYFYAANGIGTIRGMLGDPRHLPLRARANRGEMVSPWIYTSGPSLNGTSIPDAASAGRAVSEQKAAGYDFLKIHPGVTRPAFDALAAAAAEHGIRFAGHVPAEVGLARALEARYASIDHLDGYVEALAPQGSPASELFGLNLASAVDEDRIPALVATTRAAGVAMVPTQSLLEHWVGEDAPEAMAGWPEMRYVPKAQVDQWIELKRKFTAGATVEQRRRFLEVRRRLIKALHDGGVRFLLGSDGPQVWNVPGFSVHRELRYLVASGLTPYQALETGTRHVAAFFGTEGERGTIAEGRRADLLLVDGNPLESIEHTSRIHAVVLAGGILTRPAIDERLATYAKHAGR